MGDSAQWDALTDEQRERVAQAIDGLAVMGQEVTALLMRWAYEALPIIQSLCAALLKMQADLPQIKEQEKAGAYPGRMPLRAPKHAGLRDNRR